MVLFLSLKVTKDLYKCKDQAWFSAIYYFNRNLLVRDFVKYVPHKDELIHYNLIPAFRNVKVTIFLIITR